MGACNEEPATDGDADLDGDVDVDIDVDADSDSGAEDGGDADADADGPGDSGVDAEAAPDAEEAGDSGGDVDVGPGQLLVLDVTYTHNTETMAFSYFELPAGLPSDLTSSVSYATGRFYERLEVLSKPSDRQVSYQLCFFQDEHTSDNHACVSQSGLRFTAVGVYEHDQTMESIWQYGVIDWGRALLDLMLVVKDGGGNPVDTRYGFDGGWDGSPDLGLYYPMEVRYTAVIVPPGGTFEGWPE
jgi:hypothetical protein